MRVLIVESKSGLADLWRRHLERQGAEVDIAASQEAAVRYLRQQAPDVIVANLCLDDGGAFAVADFASYRHPRARVVLVSATRFFSDGSIFNLVPNACAFLKEQVPPGDLASIVAHYAG